MKQTSQQQWYIKNNIAICLNDNFPISLKTIDITNSEDREICVNIVKNLYQNQNQLYKLILKVPPILMKIIFKERYQHYLDANPTITKSDITCYFLSQNDKWFSFVNEIKKFGTQIIASIGGLAINFSIHVENLNVEVEDEIDRENNFYLMLIICYCQIPNLTKRSYLKNEIDFLHNEIGLNVLSDSKKEEILLIQNDYNCLLNRYGYFIGLISKTLSASSITIFDWVQPFNINLQTLIDISNFERDISNIFLIVVKEIKRIYSNILSRAFYCENNNAQINSYLSKDSYFCKTNKSKVINVFISQLKSKVNYISETWNISPQDISLGNVINSLTWAMQIEMLSYFTTKQKKYFWKYYVDINQYDNKIDFEIIDEQWIPHLTFIFDFFKDIRNICAHSGIFMQSIALPTLTRSFFNTEIDDDLISNNHKLKINDLLNFRKLLSQSEVLISFFQKNHLNIEWMFKQEIAETTWPPLMNFITMFPFFCTQTTFAKWCYRFSKIIKDFYVKVYHYPQNKNIPINDWKNTCLIYVKNICAYLGIDELIDLNYLLNLKLD